MSLFFQHLLRAIRCQWFYRGSQALIQGPRPLLRVLWAPSKASIITLSLYSKSIVICPSCFLQPEMGPMPLPCPQIVHLVFYQYLEYVEPLVLNFSIYYFSVFICCGAVPQNRLLPLIFFCIVLNNSDLYGEGNDYLIQSLKVMKYICIHGPIYKKYLLNTVTTIRARRYHPSYQN